VEPVVVNDFFAHPRMLECLEFVSGTLPQERALCLRKRFYVFITVINYCFTIICGLAFAHIHSL
jgi:hypothetical protein